MLTILAVAATLPVALPLLVFAAEVLAGLPGRRRVRWTGPLPRTVVLIPAHDEGRGITTTVAALGGARAAGVELLVVADNCSDDTAAIARAAGCRVVERHEPERRAKGYALAFGRDALLDDPPACVVVLDADCVVAGDGIETLARRCVADDAPMQSAYLFRPRPDAPPQTGVSNFAFLVKNLVRQQGMARLGRVAVLTGTGMAIPWSDFRAAPLATGDLVEDLALGIWLTRRGRPPRFAPEVTTWSDAAGEADLLVQRQRWEHGFIGTARRHALPLLWQGLRRRSRSTAWLGLHLLVPPLALLVSLSIAVLAVTVLLAWTGASAVVPSVLAGMIVVAGGGVLAAWACHGRDRLSVRAVLAIPRYVAGKLPIYRGLAGGGPTRWQRTRRSGEGDD